MDKYVRIKSGEPASRFITKGKLYKINRMIDNDSGYIKFDDGFERFILLNGCAFLRGGDWEFVNTLLDLLKDYNLSRLSTALGKHRSYLNKMIQQGVSDELYESIKSKITIDWTSEKPLHVNDKKHVPYTVKPVNCVLPKHKEWLQSLMMNGCVKL